MKLCLKSSGVVNSCLGGGGAGVLGERVRGMQLNRGKQIFARSVEWWSVDHFEVS